MNPARHRWPAFVTRVLADRVAIAAKHNNVWHQSLLGLAIKFAVLAARIVVTAQYPQLREFGS